MNNFGYNAAKMGLVAVLAVAMVLISFVVGYQVGNRVQASGEGQVERVEIVITATPEPSTPPPPSETPGEPRNTESSPTPEPASDSSIDPLSDEESLQVFREVWDLIDTQFYGEMPSPEERVYGAIRGLLATLDDDYTSFIEPSIAAIQREDASGTFEGIGAVVRINEDEELEIVRPFKGQPAEKAGLLAGDIVLQVDGQDMTGYGIYEAVTLIRGPKGTAVVLTIRREGVAEPFDVSIERARIDIPIVETEMYENNIGYISLFDFSATASDQLRQAVEELRDQGATSLILDLRNNPGGYLDQSVQVADLFLEDGVILIERASGGFEREYTSRDGDLAEDIPLVVLVNEASASASEIVAGALQDRGRAMLVGDRTFGKGSVQLPHTLSDGSELRVTIARWFTPNNRAIHGEGLAPDIEVPFTQEDFDAGRDPQLDRALEYLRDQP